jgi:hypothetical protein
MSDDNGLEDEVTRLLQLIQEQDTEIERLKAKCDEQATVLRRLLPDQFGGGIYFICGEGGDKDQNGLPDRIHVCPAYGADWSMIYERMNIYG